MQRHELFRKIFRKFCAKTPVPPLLRLPEVRRPIAREACKGSLQAIQVFSPYKGIHYSGSGTKELTIHLPIFTYPYSLTRFGVQPPVRGRMEASESNIRCHTNFGVFPYLTFCTINEMTNPIFSYKS